MCIYIHMYLISYTYVCVFDIDICCSMNFCFRKKCVILVFKSLSESVSVQTPPEKKKLSPCQPRNKCIARTWIVHPLLNKKRRTSPQLIQVPGNMISNHLCLIAAGRPDRANLGFDILKTTSLHDVRPMSQYLTDSGIQQPWRITLLSSLSCHKLLQPGHRGVLHSKSTSWNS